MFLLFVLYGQPRLPTRVRPKLRVLGVENGEVRAVELPVAGPAEDGPVAIIRYLSGAVGERRRVFHLVSCDAGSEYPARLVARCGEKFDRGSVEQLEGPLGMPCERCMATTGAPGASLIGAVLAMLGRATGDPRPRLAG